jgi:hypothetical protein
MQHGGVGDWCFLRLEADGGVAKVSSMVVVMVRVKAAPLWRGRPRCMCNEIGRPLRDYVCLRTTSNKGSGTWTKGTVRTTD